MRRKWATSEVKAMAGLRVMMDGSEQRLKRAAVVLVWSVWGIRLAKTLEGGIVVSGARERERESMCVCVLCV